MRSKDASRGDARRSNIGIQAAGNAIDARILGINLYRPQMLPSNSVSLPSKFVHYRAFQVGFFTRYLSFLH